MPITWSNQWEVMATPLSHFPAREKTSPVTILSEQGMQIMKQKLQGAGETFVLCQRRGAQSFSHFLTHCIAS